MIVISKDRIHHEYIEDNMKVMVDIGTTDASLTRYFTETVFVEEDVTVEDVLRHLIDYQEDISYAMEGSLGGYPLEIYLDELIVDMPVEEHLTYAEFSHEASVIEGFLTYSPRFGAMGKNIIGEGGEVLAYSIELAPIGAYKHLPIVINREFNVFKTNVVDDKEEDAVIFTTQKDFTLYEFLHALLFEISYYGTPAMREATLKDVVSSMGQDEDLAHISIAQIEQLKVTEVARLEEELKASVAAEDYERSAEIRDKIALLKRDKQGGTNAPPSV